MDFTLNISHFHYLKTIAYKVFKKLGTSNSAYLARLSREQTVCRMYTFRNYFSLFQHLDTKSNHFWGSSKSHKCFHTNPFHEDFLCLSLYDNGKSVKIVHSPAIYCLHKTIRYSVYYVLPELIEKTTGPLCKGLSHDVTSSTEIDFSFF